MRSVSSSTGQDHGEGCRNTARLVVLKVSSSYLQYYQSCTASILMGKGPVSGGELVVSKSQRDLSFRLLPICRNVKLMLGKDTVLQSSSLRWQLGCPVPLSPAAAVTSAGSPGQLGSGGAGVRGEQLCCKLCSCMLKNPDV